MPRKSPEERLSELLSRKARLSAQIDQQRARVKTRERKEDTRRKIVAGAIALSTAELDQDFGAAFFRLLDKYVERDTDRALFDLPPKEQRQAAG